MDQGDELGPFRIGTKISEHDRFAFRVRRIKNPRIERAQRGNFGDYKHLEDGLFEMKENFGPGYRIYFAVEGDEIILLLLAGTKRGQSRDIDAAQKHLMSARKGGEIK